MAGNDSIQYLSVNQSAWIDGGDGNDTLVGSNGDDVIYGRAGDDAIAGKKGVDAMFGNAGADTITGTGILVGGTEIDTLNAIGPRNLLIGGQGSDTLNAATGTTATGDLMIGSWTDWDDNLAALRSLRAEWASPQSTNTRISHLTGVTPGGLNGQYLLTSDLVSPGSTVHNDNIADINRNSNAEDWLFIFAGDQRINLIGHVNY
jgi:Ca2+-binding RTX toxin-like protein